MLDLKTEDLTVSDLAYFKYVLLTSTKFLRYLNLLAPNRSVQFQKFKTNIVYICILYDV